MRKFMAVAAFCYALAGCATTPEFRDDEITTADVIASIKCELRDAAWRLHPRNKWFEKWAAGLIVTLEVYQKGGQDSAASLVVPLNPGTFTIGLTSTTTGQATRTERIYFNEKLKKLNADTTLYCPDGPKDRHALLESHLGFADIFARSREAIDYANIKPHQLDYNIEFIIKRSGGASGAWAMIPVFRDRILSARLTVAAERNDTHAVKITLQPPPPECPVETINDQCPIAVYQVPAKVAEGNKRLLTESQRGEGVTRVTRPASDLTPAQQRSLANGLSQNVLQNIEDKLNRDDRFDE